MALTVTAFFCSKRPDGLLSYSEWCGTCVCRYRSYHDKYEDAQLKAYSMAFSSYLPTIASSDDDEEPLEDIRVAVIPDIILDETHDERKIPFLRAFFHKKIFYISFSMCQSLSCHIFVKWDN